MQKDKHRKFVDAFYKILPFALYRFARDNDNYVEKAKRIVKLWTDRKVLSKDKIEVLLNSLNGENKEAIDYVNSGEDQKVMQIAATEESPNVDHGKEKEKASNEESEEEEETTSIFEEDEASLHQWQGNTSMEEIKGIVDQIQSYLNNLGEKALNGDEDLKAEVLYTELLDELEDTQSKEIQDDLVGDKVARDREIFKRIKESKSSTEEKSNMESEKLQTQKENELYKIKVIKETIELDLDDFLKHISDHQVRLELSFDRYSTLMEKVEKLYEVAENEVKVFADIREKFRKECTKIGQVNRLLSQQQAQRKRKREVEEKQKIDLQSKTEAENLLNSIGSAAQKPPIYTYPSQQQIYSYGYGTRTYNTSYTADVSQYSQGQSSHALPSTSQYNTTSSNADYASFYPRSQNTQAQTNQFQRQHQPMYNQITSTYPSSTNGNNASK